MFPGLIAYDGVLVCDHVEAAGEELFALACKRDLEDIMARHKFGPYLQDSAQWFKIRNRKYSQWGGREKFFERERDVDSDIFLWDSCIFVAKTSSSGNEGSAMPIPQRALSVGLAAMRRLNSAWDRLTTLRKVIVVGIAVMTAVAALTNAFVVYTMLVLPCVMLLLLIWGLSRLFGPLGLSKWSENIRVALALAVVVGFFLFFGLMVSIPEPLFFRHAELNAEMQEVKIERNKVRIGMMINDVLPVVHGMEITASADAAWLSVLPDNKRFYYSPDPIEAWQHDDGTFTLSCHCGSAQVSPNSHVTEAQAAVVMKQRMSDGFDWSWQYKTFKRSREYFFTVTFGRDGRVNQISDVYYTDLRSHRA